jgi:hypothetical protein
MMGWRHYSIGGDMSEETFTIESLIEANNILQDEVSRVRVSNRTLRTVFKALRAANESLRRQVEVAQANDDLFKRYCAGEFDAPNQFDAVVEAPTTEGGLPTAEGQAEQSV